MIGAVTTAVVAGISVFNEAAIPGQLETWLTQARSHDVGPYLRMDLDALVPDVRSASERAELQILLRAASSVSTTELYAAFILNTLPNYPGTEPAPAAQPGDPRLVVAGTRSTGSRTRPRTARSAPSA